VPLAVQHALARAVADGLVLIDEDERIVEINPAAEALFGYPMDLLVGKPVGILLPTSFRERFHEAVAEYAEYLATGYSPVVGQSIATAVLKASGHEVPVEFTLTAIPMAGHVFFGCQVRDVSERLLSEERMRRSMDFKEELLGLISHELRSPLTAIRGNVNLLAKTPVSRSAEEETSIRQLQEYVERMERVVSNMLSLGKVESGREIPLEPLLLQRVVPAAVEQFQRTRPRPVQVFVQDALPMALGDATFVTQVLENLLSNADKYSPAGKEIHVEVRANGSSIEIMVRDQGESMRPDELNRLFDPFFRSEKHSGKAPGIGLGLTVCKRLVEAQRGRIWARPAPEGGAIFAFSLMALDDRDLE
jgi:PAS domain S-box-containing protein